MRGETTDSKEMANSAGSGGVEGGVVTGPVHATSLQNNSNLSSNSKINANVKFSSQSPSEDKSIHYGLPCETDHMYANYSETSTYRDLANEVSHLKALLLFHLDLIQQQSELNASKDKQLSTLKHDNEMLKQRLERMERRVQLQNQKQKCDVPADTETVAPLTKIPEPSLQRVPDDVKPYLPDSIEIPVKVETEENQVPRKRIKTLLPVKRKEKKPNKMTADLETSLVVEDHILDDLIIQAVKEGAIINVSDSAVTDDIVEAKVILEPVKLNSSPRKLGKTTTSLQQLSTTTKSPITTEHRRIQQLLLQKAPPRESQHLKRENIITCDHEYLTYVGECHESNELETMSNEGLVEVPQWSIKPIPGRLALEMEENLDDEVFSKRHLKHELDEKRRKRWDAQRIREQRQYEKLRARYEGEDRSQDRSSCPTRSEATTTSFWQSPEDVTHMQIETWLPVSVFGAPLPNIIQTDFQLPWSSSRTELSSKKRQRRC